MPQWLDRGFGAGRCRSWRRRLTRRPGRGSVFATTRTRPQRLAGLPGADRRRPSVTMTRRRTVGVSCHHRGPLDEAGFRRGSHRLRGPGANPLALNRAAPRAFDAFQSSQSALGTGRRCHCRVGIEQRYRLRAEGSCRQETQRFVADRLGGAVSGRAGRWWAAVRRSGFGGRVPTRAAPRGPRQGCWDIDAAGAVPPSPGAVLRPYRAASPGE